jgi:TonB family protein
MITSSSFVVISAVLLFASTSAQSQEPLDSWIRPSQETLRRYWPRAKGQSIYGTLVLDCAVSTDGKTNDCKIKSANPDDADLIKAIPMLAGLYTARNKPPSGRAVLRISLMFDTPPDWMRKPTFDQVLAVFPAKATAAGLGGRATIKCWVQTNGLLRDCKVAQESPTGYGFGEAALTLTPSFLMKPAIKQGKSVESDVTIPINFSNNSGLASRSFGSSIRVLKDPLWIAAPAAEDVNSAITAKVRKDDLAGQVAMQCDVVRKTGKLGSCTVMNSSVYSAGFEAAAKALVSKFQISAGELSDVKTEVRVNLSFDFPNMTGEGWEKRRLTHPQWIRAAKVDPSTPLFPEEAAKAGLKAGSALVECTVAAGGALTNCATVTESTPNMGFGEIALAVAGAYAVNPWDDGGLPTEGALVRMPVTLKLAPETAAGPPKP